MIVFDFDAIQNEVILKFVVGWVCFGYANYFLYLSFFLRSKSQVTLLQKIWPFMLTLQEKRHHFGVNFNCNLSFNNFLPGLFLKLLVDLQLYLRLIVTSNRKINSVLSHEIIGPSNDFSRFTILRPFGIKL